MNLVLKHLDAESYAYIKEAKNSFDERARKIAVKIVKVEGLPAEDLYYATIVAKRTIGEYNRTKGNSNETYTEEMYVYGTPYRTAFNYIVKNYNHFFTYFKFLVDTYGEENIEIHRTSEDYSAESVVALLVGDHKAVHSKQYVTYEYTNEENVRMSFNSKEALKAHYKLTKQELLLALDEKQILNDGNLVIIKIVSSSVEVDFVKEIKRTENLLQILEREKLKAPKVKEQRVRAQQIAQAKSDLNLVTKLLQQDNDHNDRVQKLLECDPDKLWDKVASELQEKYHNQKEAILNLVDDGVIELFDGKSLIPYKYFFEITDDFNRIEFIIRDLKRYEIEFKEAYILVKLKDFVA
ncbi:hypothetical protein [Lysinibacillus sphaericus]|uniref:hypothetical protein n=1 Tax=Lysinibacillus sphaericus TaxID=1421 RepID=UPI003D74D717